MDLHGSRGFTLLELIIVVVMLGITTTIALPALGNLVEQQRAHVANQRLIISLNLARSHAVATGTIVAVCRSQNATSCDDAAGWHAGWLVFEAPTNVTTCMDSAGDGLCDGHGGRILHVEQQVTSGDMWITHNSNVDLRVRFNGMGLSPGSNGRFTVCSSNNTALRGIVVAQTGRIRPADDSQHLPCET